MKSHNIEYLMCLFAIVFLHDSKISHFAQFFFWAQFFMFHFVCLFSLWIWIYITCKLFWTIVQVRALTDVSCSVGRWPSVWIWDHLQDSHCWCVRSIVWERGRDNESGMYCHHLPSSAPLQARDPVVQRWWAGPKSKFPCALLWRSSCYWATPSSFLPRCSALSF